MNTMPFFIGNNRAMISLGTLTDRKYCPYDCAFCYVKSGFSKYAKMEISDIIEFLQNYKERYDIVYISGDTDSFAPPRTQKAIELVKRISESINTDILFTTRTVFSKEDLKKLTEISNYMKNKKYKLIACVSISRLFSADWIEPYPIPSPERRIETLKNLKENGIFTMLATRPFLPVITAGEYIEIIKETQKYVDAVLGEIWYADDKLIKSVCKNVNIEKIDFKEKEMDFDNNHKSWKCYEAKETVDEVTKYCKENHIPFFMRSKPAVEYIRNLL